MTNDDVIAILCGDIHLSHNPPSARAEELDWYGAMARPLNELQKLADGHGVPIVCSGDVFDRWNSPPELISFALDCLPTMFAVPGQHDLPNHNFAERHRSAYGVLERAKRITTLDHKHPVCVKGGRLILYGYPWGEKLNSPSSVGKDEWIHLAVVHQYLWTKKRGGYPGAPIDQRLDQMAAPLAGYNVALFGDNHQSLTGVTARCDVLNCGSFMRRHADDRNHRPIVGLLWRNGGISPHYLNTDQDIFTDTAAANVSVADGYDFSGFLDDLDGLGDDSLDFRRVVEMRLLDVDDEDVRHAILTAIKQEQ